MGVRQPALFAARVGRRWANLRNIPCREVADTMAYPAERRQSALSVPPIVSNHSFAGMLGAPQRH